MRILAIIAERLRARKKAKIYRQILRDIDRARNALKKLDIHGSRKLLAIQKLNDGVTVISRNAFGNHRRFAK